MCPKCSGSLYKGELPAFAIANKFWFGPNPPAPISSLDPLHVYLLSPVTLVPSFKCHAGSSNASTRACPHSAERRRVFLDCTCFIPAKDVGTDADGVFRIIRGHAFAKHPRPGAPEYSISLPALVSEHKAFAKRNAFMEAIPFRDVTETMLNDRLGKL